MLDQKIAAMSLPKPLPGFGHVNRYWDKSMQTAAAKILPGECYVSTAGEMIVTVLGSCIAACVRDKNLGIGGMNHFMLPVQLGEEGIQRLNSTNPALCYGNWAMEFLINAILKQGGRKEHLEVKIFGGGQVLAAMTSLNVGHRNIEFVNEYLRLEGFRIAAQDVGGDYPRKVLYFADTGAVKMRRIRTTANDTIQKREKAYLQSIAKPAESGSVELF